MTEDREQQIRQRAYRIWQDEGEPEGREQDHWSRAQAELGDAPAGGDDELIPGSGDDLPFGEPEDTGVADASLGAHASDSDATVGSETPDTSGIAAAGGVPIAPAPQGRKGKGAGNSSI